MGWPCATSRAKLGPESAPIESRSPAGSDESRRALQSCEEACGIQCPLSRSRRTGHCAKCERRRWSSGAQELGGNHGDHDVGGAHGRTVASDGDRRAEWESREEIACSRRRPRSGLRDSGLCAHNVQSGRRGGAARERGRFPTRRNLSTTMRLMLSCVAPIRYSVPANRRRIFCVMLDDDEQARPCIGRRRRAGGRASGNKEPGKDGKAGRSNHGCNRDIAGETKIAKKTPMAASAAQGQQQERLQIRWPRLCLRENEARRKHVAENGKEGGKGLERCATAPQASSR